MKFIIKTIILFFLLAIIFAMLLRVSNRNDYEILKPEIISYNDDRSSWGIIMDVKKQVLKNIENNWKKKHTNERK